MTSRKRSSGPAAGKPARRASKPATPRPVKPHAPGVEFLVITGLAGSGRSSAIKAFEDLGAYCVDNLPTALLPSLLELARRGSLDLDLVVLGMDIRERHFVR